jgi:hypothetical protein
MFGLLKYWSNFNSICYFRVWSLQNSYHLKQLFEILNISILNLTTTNFCHCPLRSFSFCLTHNVAVRESVRRSIAAECKNWKMVFAAMSIFLLCLFQACNTMPAAIRYKQLHTGVLMKRKPNVQKCKFRFRLTAILRRTLCCLRVCARTSLSDVGMTQTASQICLVMELS